MEKPCFILTVDPDHFLQEMIESGFGLFKPDWKLLKTDDPETARAMLHGYQVDAVITEIAFPANGTGAPEASAAGLLADLERSFPKVPVFVLTEVPAEEVQSLTTADYIAKPPDMDYLIGKVHRAIQQNRGSVVRGISLESLLQLLELERKTCTLVVRSAHRVGRLYQRDGMLAHAETAELSGKPAAFAILAWTDYSIEILEECRAETSLGEGMNAILMEWCVQRDHGQP